jgi:tRNA threonylcarbamoyl adenosine modification protein YeaZ
MNGLILETSTEKGCLILTTLGKPIAHKNLPDGPELSKSLAKEVDLILKKFQFQPDFISVGTGPGSYTGIRVGAALAKALGFGWNIPVFGFCSLKAFTPQNKTAFAILLDARMGGIFALTSDAQTPVLIPINEAQQTLSSFDLFISPHPEKIKKRIELKGNWIEASPDFEYLSDLSYDLFLKGEAPPLILSYLSHP